MTTPVLEVEDLAKSFRTYRSEWQRVALWFGASPTPAAEHVVLQDVSFDMTAGQALGVVGENGAGKSTLLKLITGTLAPTRGSVAVRGRISAILELGLGFNPELTGRQNVYYSAGLMGFTQRQISRLIPEIEDFAEIGEYFDQPIRTYSSGMRMRIAFSVVTAVRPEILIVDEALSVGDAYFQHKSIERIRWFREEGTSLLLVSHDPAAVKSICDCAILLESGRMIRDGKPDEVLDYYNALIADREDFNIDQRMMDDGRVQTRSGNRDAVIGNVRLLDKTRESVEYVKVGETVTLAVQVDVRAPIPDLTIGYMIRDRLGQAVFGTNTHSLGEQVRELVAGDPIEILFTFPANLGVGSYSITVALHAGNSHVIKSYDWWDRALVFNVVNAGQSEFTGIAWIPTKVECSR